MKRISLFARDSRDLREKRDGSEVSSSRVAPVAYVLLVSLTIYERRTKRMAEYHSRRHDARRFPVDESEDGTSVDLVAEGDVEHHSESDGNAPKTRQPLDREKDGTPEVQRP